MLDSGLSISDDLYSWPCWSPTCDYMLLPSVSRSRSQWVTSDKDGSMIVSFRTLDNLMRSYLTWSLYLALWTILSLRQTIGAIAIVLICPPCTDHNCKDGRISGGLFWLLSSVVSQKLSGTFKCARNDLFKCYQTIGTTRHLILADPKKKTFTRSDISIGWFDKLSKWGLEWCGDG